VRLGKTYKKLKMPLKGLSKAFKRPFKSFSKAFKTPLSSNQKAAQSFFAILADGTTDLTGPSPRASEFQQGTKLHAERPLKAFKRPFKGLLKAF